MALCASLVTMPNGKRMLAEDLLATSQHDLAVCEYVVETGTEYSSFRQLLSMSPDSALQLGGAIALVWAIAWGFRTLSKSISTYEGNQNE